MSVAPEARDNILASQQAAVMDSLWPGKSHTCGLFYIQCVPFLNIHMIYPPVNCATKMGGVGRPFFPG